MGTLIYILIGAAAIFFAIRTSILAGTAAVVIVFAIIAYTLYPKYTIGRANAEFTNGNKEKALSMYAKIIKSGRADFETRISYASLLMRADNAETALEEINKVLARHLEQKIKYSAKQIRCMINYRLGNMDEAMEEINELFEDGYKTSNTYSIMGYFMLITNAPLDKTLSLCEEAYDYDNEERDILDNLEVCYFKSGQLEKAKKISDELCELAPEFVEGFYHGAQLYSTLGDNVKAREYANHIKDCKRSVMTTVSESEVDALAAELNR